MTRARLVRFLVFVTLLLGCGGSKTPRVAGAQDTVSASTAAPSATTAAAASAAPPQAPTVASPWHPLLYRIHGTKPSYLFGTIHVPDARLATFPPELDGAISECNEIVNEMPLDNTNPVSMMSAFQLPKGKSLSTELPAPLYRRLKGTFVQKGLGAAFPKLEHMKVWAIAAQVALLDHLEQLQGSGGQAIDMSIHEKAKDEGKATSGLETQAEQLQVFDGLTRDEQARMLEQTLDQRDKDVRDGNDPVAKLMSLYVAGTEAPLLAELNAGFDLTRPLDQKMLKRLITDRNKIMTDRIAALTAAHPATGYFFAVGAAHLLGDDGIIAQLKKKGMKIDRVTP